MKVAAVPVYRDSHCPKRGIGLNHTTDGSSTCVHCGLETYTRDGPGISGAYGMAAFLAHLRGYNKEPEPEVDPPKETDFAALTPEQWHHMVEARGEYERGRLTDWPDVVELNEEDRTRLDDIADALLRLFRRVE
jgi:hypothetical protein